jgi:dynein heavy chain
MTEHLAASSSATAFCASTFAFSPPTISAYSSAVFFFASKFLVDVEMSSDEIRAGIEKFMPYSFKVVDKFSDMILEQERRTVYTTPKSFLELIKLFKVMQQKKEGDLIATKEKYETGVIKLQETGEVVAKLEDELKIFSVEVEAKKKTADE